MGDQNENMNDGAAPPPGDYEDPASAARNTLPSPSTDGDRNSMKSATGNSQKPTLNSQKTTFNSQKSNGGKKKKNRKEKSKKSARGNSQKSKDGKKKNKKDGKEKSETVVGETVVGQTEDEESKKSKISQAGPPQPKTVEEYKPYVHEQYGTPEEMAQTIEQLLSSQKKLARKVKIGMFSLLGIHVILTIIIAIVCSLFSFGVIGDLFP